MTNIKSNIDSKSIEKTFENNLKPNNHYFKTKLTKILEDEDDNISSVDDLNIQAIQSSDHVILQR